MDLQARKYQFIQELINVNSTSVMDKLEKVLKKELPVKRETLSEYNEEIDQAIRQIEKGEFFSHEEVRKKAEKW